MKSCPDRVRELVYFHVGTVDDEDLLSRIRDAVEAAMREGDPEKATPGEVLAALRESARQALGVLEDLSETEMACLRGRGDDAIEALEKALEATQADEVEPETVVADAVHTCLETMTAGQRLVFLSKLAGDYCPRCGGDTGGHYCQCWNDE